MKLNGKTILILGVAAVALYAVKNAKDLAEGLVTGAGSVLSDAAEGVLSGSKNAVDAGVKKLPGANKDSTLGTWLYDIFNDY